MKFLLSFPPNDKSIAKCASYSFHVLCVSVDFSVSQFLVNLLIRIQAPDVALYVGRDNGNYMNGTVDEVRFRSQHEFAASLLYVYSLRLGRELM